MVAFGNYNNHWRHVAPENNTYCQPSLEYAALLWEGQEGAHHSQKSSTKNKATFIHPGYGMGVAQFAN